MSPAEGKVAKLHLPVFVTDANSSLPLRLPAAQPPLPEVRGGIRRRTLTRSAARHLAEERAQAMLEFSLYGILGYQTHYPFLINRGPEPEQRAHFQRAAGDSVYKAKLFHNN